MLQPELLLLADRVLVMCEGRQTGILERADATQENIMRLAAPGLGERAAGAAGSISATVSEISKAASLLELTSLRLAGTAQIR